ncbi:hypothetical protein LCW_07780 [Latilactobacillus curvatus]|nr:hypothetical protein LCW_07780 [Latilactobacillus curvatus]
MKVLKNMPRLELKDEPSPFQNREARLQKQFNWDALRGWGGAYSDWLYQTMADFDQRFDDQINLTPQSSEIIDARRDIKGFLYATLKKRLDTEQSSDITHLAVTEVDEMQTLRINGLTKASTPVKYANEKQVNDALNPRSQGLMIQSVSLIKLKKVSDIA